MTTHTQRRMRGGRVLSPVIGLTLACLAMASIASGCGPARGIPSHGGGKRFDEEQRAVAGAVRQALSDMDLSDLRQKRVQIVLESLSQDGGGYVLSWPGLQNLNLSGSTNSSNGYYRDGDNGNQGAGASASANFANQAAYVSHAFASSADLQYLRASLEMKSRHEQIAIVQGDAEVMLYVLVDVLGTNRSREDNILASREMLAASCECTYYATDARTGKLLLPARRVSAQATYAEAHHLGATGNAVTRTLDRVPPSAIPTPTTQPTIQ